MEPYVINPVAEELDSLMQYLSTQPSELHISIDGQIPDGRYLIPNSLVLIVQHAQRTSHYPLHISISFLKHTVEISYTIHPRHVPDEHFPDIASLVATYRKYYHLPTVWEADSQYTISIPLFI